MTKSVQAIGGCFGNGTSVAHYKSPAHSGGIVKPPITTRTLIEARTLQDPRLYQPPYSLSKDTLAQVTLKPHQQRLIGAFMLLFFGLIFGTLSLRRYKSVDNYSEFSESRALTGEQLAQES